MTSARTGVAPAWWLSLEVGCRVQRSVFVCVLGHAHLVELTRRVEEIIDVGVDSVYAFGRAAALARPPLTCGFQRVVSVKRCPFCSNFGRGDRHAASG
jgi:CRISPR/Cas system-associated endoribonuclease Cas2